MAGKEDQPCLSQGFLQYIENPGRDKDIYILIAKSIKFLDTSV